MSGAPEPQVWQEFPPQALREYALIADGRRGALIGPRGDIAWLCAPRWHHDAVIASLVGGEGVYAVTPAEIATWDGYHERGSLIWRSRWVTSTTLFECREALAQPADARTVVLLRRIEAGEQDAAVRVVLRLGRDFGRGPVDDVRRLDDGTWTARLGNLAMRWSGCPQAVRDEQGGWTAEVVVPAGGTLDLVLEISDQPLGAPTDPDEAWRATAEWWQQAVPDLGACAAPRDARHAYAVLAGLSDPDGGTVAAATMGLPERAEAGRSYDYRYVWVRDQAYVGLSAAIGEPQPLMDDAVRHITRLVLEHGGQLAPAYTVEGDDVPHEHHPGVVGYPGGRDVVGNWVRGQFQLDTFGEVLQLLSAAAHHGHLDADGARALEVAAQVIEQRWLEPEAGIWELHDAWWTHSRLSCVAGLKAAGALTHLPASTQDRWADLADAVLRETSARCLADDGSWRRSPDHAGTDAALLLPPVRGALPADDPRTVATLRRVDHDLTEDGYVYRYDDGEQPLGQAEGAFTLCGFTMALATAYAGDSAAALRWFERSRAICGPPALLAEEFDVRGRQLRGNLPQAFSHAMLLETAQRLAIAGPLGTG